MKRVVIAGSRDFSDYYKAQSFIREYIAEAVGEQIWSYAFGTGRAKEPKI